MINAEAARELSMSNNFAAKIILFGEYTLITGSKGLAFPYSGFRANFKRAENASDIENQFKLDKFLNYLRGTNTLASNMDLDRLEADIAEGIYVQSDIPAGYGLGSSGSLCAAIYARYAPNFERKGTYTQQELAALKDVMALMEDYYHGSSSGLDCLISLINQSILISERNKYKIVEMPDLANLGSFYLYDSGIPRKTAPFVHLFLDRYDNDSAYKDKIDGYCDDVDKLIDNVLIEDKSQFIANFAALSEFQFEYFSEMIPEKVRDIWGKGLQTGQYYFKLCGAGGGGYFIVYSNDKEFNKGCDYLAIA